MHEIAQKDATHLDAFPSLVAAIEGPETRREKSVLFPTRATTP